MNSLVIDARMINASGIGVYLQNLVPYLSQRYNTTLIGDIDELAKINLPLGVNIIPASSPIYSVKEQLELYKKSPICDIFWSPHYNIPLLPVPARKRVVTIHDTYHLAYRDTLSIFQKIYANYFLKAAVRRSDKVITVSQFSKGEIVKFTGASPSAVSVVQNGVDSFKFNVEKKQFARQQLSKSMPNLPDREFILYVGNVKPHKNLLTLLSAFANLSEEKVHDFNLVIAGKKEGFITGDKSLSALLHQNEFLKNRVYFTGYVEDEDLPLLYNSASLFVFPSLYEGFGLPPLEAMACGCPVVASEAASIPEICGKAALYFNTLDYTELKTRMKEVLLNKEKSQTLIALGFKQAALYQWQTAAEKHQAIFDKLMLS